VLCGAFVNLDAVVDRLRQSNSTKVLLACAGDEGEVALEDLLFAGAVAERLNADGVECTDAARAAALAYRSAASELEKAISSSKHAQALVRAGFSSDITIAARVNAASVVPVLANERLIAARVQ
jgi:2-phosphosulfolactate phosphatase